MFSSRRSRLGARTSVITALVITAMALAGCGSSHSAAARRAVPTPATHPVKGPHLVVVIEENHSYNQIVGSPIALRANELATTGVSLTNFYAITHPSLPNYIALTSGGTHGITKDCGKCDLGVPNLIDQLEHAKISWRAYAQGFPGQCSRQPLVGAYAKKHIPFLYYRSVFERPSVCAKVVGLDRFWSDTRAGTLPTVSFVIPDLDNDMHGVGEGRDRVKVARQADKTLGRIMDDLRAPRNWTHGSRLVVTWDEGGGGHEPRTSCCGGRAAGGHIPTLVSGPDLPAGPDSVDHDHYDLLRSFEARYHLPLLGHAADPTSRSIPSVVGT
ncbi:MAG: alkaline phosphatase family protein [Actinomycetota bacterium]|nr:alkaline phosphatase family protein [Actinomycetota bacterium]